MPTPDAVTSTHGAKPDLAAYAGTYLGISPTDESAVMMGEIEIVISQDSVSVRMATGLKIEANTVPISSFTPMSRKEVSEEFKPGAAAVATVVGFRLGQVPKLLFTKNPENGELTLIVRMGEMSELLGPTVLIDAAQVSRGRFNEMISAMEGLAGKGVLPRLRNDGKAEQ